MRRRRTCLHCAQPSIAGLRDPLCQHHFNILMFGQKWANEVRERPDMRTGFAVEMCTRKYDKWVLALAPNEPMGRAIHRTVKEARAYIATCKQYDDPMWRRCLFRIRNLKTRKVVVWKP